MMTFRNRVENFWQWFSGNVETIQQHLDDNRHDLIGESTMEPIRDLLPEFDLIFSRTDEDTYSFTLSPNGNIDLRFMAEYWLSRSPAIEGWKFYSSRQPGRDKEYTIDVNGNEFPSLDARVRLDVDEEKELIDIAIWHPAFVDDDDINSQVAFIFLDETLGEVGTEMWIGSIDLAVEEQEGSIPLSALPTEVVAAASMHQWERQTPDRTYTAFTVETPGEGFPRADTIAGSTCHFPLIGEFMEREGLLDEDPIAEWGARYVYLSIDARDFPEDEEVETRARIEEQLDVALREQHLGRVIGGATGFRNAYIDLLLVDGDNSLRAVEESMATQNLAASFRMEPFFQGQEV